MNIENVSEVGGVRLHLTGKEVYFLIEALRGVSVPITCPQPALGVLYTLRAEISFAYVNRKQKGGE